MALKSDSESWGLGSEVIGLLLLFLSVVWQAAVGDFFVSNAPESIAYEQERVNLGILTGIEVLGNIAQEADPAERAKDNDRLSKIVNTAIGGSMEERYTRTNAVHAQAAASSKIRTTLAVLGALLVIVGKGLVFLHKSKKST